MKIADTRRAAYTSAARRAGGATTGPSPMAAANVAETSDTVSILGIPDAELTPKVRGAIMGLLEEVQSLGQELGQTAKRIAYLEQLADQDTLLPVINRRAFVRELSRLLSFGERYGVTSSMLYFDVNGMKRINDNHSHAAGDAALGRVARILAESVRESDVVGRLGGDEFGDILAQSELSVAHEKAESLAAQIAAAALEWKGQLLPIDASYGAYSFGGEESSADSVLEQADKAMYERKRALGGR
jgi:diguanylate cyclase (GGDEF)-like protein